MQLESPAVQIKPEHHACYNGRRSVCNEKNLKITLFSNFPMQYIFIYNHLILKDFFYYTIWGGMN